MKPKSMLFMAVAVACGLVAMLGVHQQMNANESEEIPQVNVLVATAEIPPGVKLDETNVVLKKWPKENVPEGAVTTTDEYEERALITRAYPGEVVLLAKLGDKGVFGAASAIPDGMRVVSIPVDMTMTHSGLLQPHDRVDVMVTFKIRGERSGYINRTRTVLQFVEVFATDSKRDSAGGEKEETKAKNVSLLVTPQQGALLKLAESKGTLHLALRSKTDRTNLDSAIDVSDSDFEQMLAGSDSMGVQESEGEESAHDNGDIVGFLDQQDHSPVEAIVAPTPVEHKWTVEVFSGGERKSVEVKDDPPAGEVSAKRMPLSGVSTGSLAMGSGGSVLQPFLQWFGGVGQPDKTDLDDVESSLPTGTPSASSGTAILAQ